MRGLPRRWLIVALVLAAAAVLASLPTSPVRASRDTRNEILVRVGADGSADVLRGATSHQRASVLAGPVRFGDGRDANDPAVGVLRDAIRQIADEGPRAPNGASQLRLRIEAAPEARTIWIEFVFFANIQSGSRISRFTLSTRGEQEAIDYDWVQEDRQRILPASDLLVEIQASESTDAGAMEVLFVPIGSRSFAAWLEDGEAYLQEQESRTVTQSRGQEATAIVHRPTLRVRPDGTPLGLETLADRLAALLSRMPESDIPVVYLSAPFTGPRARARTVLDCLAALDRVEGCRVIFGHLFRTTRAEPGR